MAEKLIDVFLGVGSNIEPEKHILAALELLKQHVRVTGVSTFYWTEALGRPDQPRFLNGVWRVETSVEASPLKFDVLWPIETELGRIRTQDKHAARTIDLDILLYGDAVIDQPDLRIPDPDIRTRPFITIPLLELEPDLVLPDTGQQLALIVGAADGEGLEPAAGFTERLSISK